MFSELKKIDEQTKHKESKNTSAPPVPPKKFPSSPAQSKRKQQRTEAHTQSTSQATSQSISQPPSQPIHKIVDRPKAFYITEQLDDTLDKAVRYLQKKHGIKKVDRSVIVNALLDNDTLWTDGALDQLVDRVVSQLTSRLIS